MPALVGNGIDMPNVPFFAIATIIRAAVMLSTPEQTASRSSRGMSMSDSLNTREIIAQYTVDITAGTPMREAR